MPKDSKKKKEDDLGRPRRGLSSFMIFANERRGEIKLQFPTIKITEIGKKLGEHWNALTEEERKKYEEESRREHQRYLKEMEVWRIQYPNAIEPPRRRKKFGGKLKDPRKPKRAMSSFMFFMNQKRPQVRQERPELKLQELGKVFSEKWKALNAEEKKVYEEMAKKDKERSEIEMDAYNKLLAQESAGIVQNNKQMVEEQVQFHNNNNNSNNGGTMENSTELPVLRRGGQGNSESISDISSLLN